MLDETAALAEPSPELEGTQQADVCIVGGGYLGLWTAIRLLDADPGLRVCVIEADECGNGASGRNSGMVLPWWTKFEALEAVCGTEEALWLCHASVAAIEEINAVCGRHGIDIEFQRVGWLWGSTCTAQDGRWLPVVEALARHGCTPFTLLERAAVQARVRAEGYRCGAYDETCASLQPAKLARGLKRIAVAKGAVIHERSPMLSLLRGSNPAVLTPKGRINAGKVVLAINAWSLAVPELRRGIFVLTSDDAISAPAGDFLERHCWTNGPIITNSAVFVAGYRPTRDGRIVAGVTGGAIGFGSLVGQRFAGRSPRENDIAAAFATAFCPTEGIAWTSSWRGPIDRTPNGNPVFGPLPGEDRIFFGYGFSGNGIVGCNVGSNIMASLVLDRDDRWSRSGLVHPPEPWMPAEPARYIGAHAVRWAVRQKDRLDAAGRRQGRIAARLAALAPGGIVTTPTRAGRGEST